MSGTVSTELAIWISNGFLLGLGTSPSCPSNSLIIRHGWNNALVKPMMIGAGAVTGYGVMFMIAVTVVLPMISSFVWAVPVMNAIGAGVFFIFGVRLFRTRNQFTDRSYMSSTGISQPGTENTATERIRLFLSGLTATATNPINIVWWMGLLGPTVGAASQLRTGYVLGVPAGSLTWFIAASLGIHFAGRQFSGRIYNRVSIAGGAILLIFAFWFGTEAVRGRWF